MRAGVERRERGSSQLRTGNEKSSFLAMYETGRGIATPRIGGSKFEMWFAATTSPPVRGTFSAPTTRYRNSAPKIARTTTFANA